MPECSPMMMTLGFSTPSASLGLVLMVSPRPPVIGFPAMAAVAPQAVFWLSSASM